MIFTLVAEDYMDLEKKGNNTLVFGNIDIAMILYRPKNIRAKIFDTLGWIDEIEKIISHIS
jgi:hypothetical protein